VKRFESRGGRENPGLTLRCGEPWVRQWQMNEAGFGGSKR
jgi:hypothetical protein